MNLEEFLDIRLTREQLELLNNNSKIERIEKDKDDSKLTITLPKEFIDMINSNTECKNILRSNIIRFMRSLKSDEGVECLLLRII